MDLRWDRVPGALVYEVEIAQNPSSDERHWQRVSLTSRPKLIISDLEPNSVQCFRVRAIGTQTESPYSQELLTKAAA